MGRTWKYPDGTPNASQRVTQSEETVFRFYIYGLPVPYTRMLKKAKKTAQAERYVGWKDRVAGEARIAGAELWDGPIYLRVEVHVFERGKWDLDNVFKGVADALNGICYADDKQVTGFGCRLFVGTVYGPQRVEVTVIRE